MNLNDAAPWSPESPGVYADPWIVPWYQLQPARRMPELATIPRRACALGVDAVLGLALTFFGMLAIWAIQKPLIDSGLWDDAIVFLVTQLSLYLFAIMIILLFTVTGASPGKRLFGVRIVTASGTAPGLARSCLRNLFILIPIASTMTFGTVLNATLGHDEGPIARLPMTVWAICVLIWFLGCIAATYSATSQALHDKLAGTYVIRS